MEHSSAGNGTAGRGGPPHGYLPIEEHGIVGDLRTVALIGTDGTVDWYCPSRFDAPSLFGALLDKRRGGYFSLTARTSYAKPSSCTCPIPTSCSPASRARTRWARSSTSWSPR